MYGRHLECTTADKHPIDLLEKPTKPVHLPTCRAGLQAREFEKLEMGKMLKRQIFEPAHTE